MKATKTTGKTPCGYCGKDGGWLGLPCVTCTGLLAKAWIATAIAPTKPIGFPA